MPKLPKYKAAFTLIELLIVITIIGTLVTLAYVSFANAQVKARDSKRKQDLETLKKAMELAKSDSPSGFFYPGCTPLLGGACYINSEANFSVPIVSDGYIQSIPKNPKTGYPYIYVPQPSGCTTTNKCTGFVFATQLENANDQDITTSQKKCNIISGGTVYEVCDD